MKQILLLIIVCFSSIGYAQDVAILKYNGGGDWYANPTAVTNLVTFANANIKTTISKNPQAAAVGSEDLFNYPDMRKMLLF